MYRREFEQRLAKGLPKAVLLYGENSYLIEDTLKHYRKTLDASDSLLALYHDEYEFERAKSYLSQSSLFGGANLLIVRRDKKIPKRELDSLVELCNRRSENYFLFVFQGAAKEAKQMHSSFLEKRGGVWVRYFEPTPKEALETLRRQADQLKLEIDNYALNHLLLLLENNLALAAKELEKLSILQRPITSKEIDRLVYSSAPLAVEKLLVDLFHKKPIAQTLERLLELGSDEFEILRATQRFVQQIFLFHAYIRIHGLADSKEILGYKLPRHIEDQKSAIAARIKTATWVKIHEHLLQSELQLKKSRSDYKESELYGILIRLQALL